MGGKHFRTLKRLNKGKKYNSNTLKNKNNRTKRLAILSGCFSKQLKMQIQLTKIDTKIYNTIMPLIY